MPRDATCIGATSYPLCSWASGWPILDVDPCCPESDTSAAVALVRRLPRHLGRDVPVDVHDHAAVVEEDGEVARRRVPAHDPAQDAGAMQDAVPGGLAELMAQL